MSVHGQNPFVVNSSAGIQGKFRKAVLMENCHAAPAAHGSCFPRVLEALVTIDPAWADRNEGYFSCRIPGKSQISVFPILSFTLFSAK